MFAVKSDCHEDRTRITARIACPQISINYGNLIQARPHEHPRSSFTGHGTGLLPAVWNLGADAISLSPTSNCV